jgi:hypothetical protein
MVAIPFDFYPNAAEFWNETGVPGYTWLFCDSSAHGGHDERGDGHSMEMLDFTGELSLMPGKIITTGPFIRARYREILW